MVALKELTMLAVNERAQALFGMCARRLHVDVLGGGYGQIVYESSIYQNGTQM